MFMIRFEVSENKAMRPVLTLESIVGYFVRLSAYFLQIFLTLLI